MRSYRYKYSNHTACCPLLVCSDGGWRYVYTYIMKNGKGDMYFYTIKHSHRDTITRIFYRFASQFDQENLIFSNMIEKRRRHGKKYYMHN